MAKGKVKVSVKVSNPTFTLPGIKGKKGKAAKSRGNPAKISSVKLGF